MSEDVVSVALNALSQISTRLGNIEEAVKRTEDTLQRHIGFCREDMGEMYVRIGEVEKQCAISQEVRAIGDRQAAAAPHWAKLVWAVVAALIGAAVTFGLMMVR